MKIIIVVFSVLITTFFVGCYYIDETGQARLFSVSDNQSEDLKQAISGFCSHNEFYLYCIEEATRRRSNVSLCLEVSDGDNEYFQAMSTLTEDEFIQFENHFKQYDFHKVSENAEHMVFKECTDRAYAIDCVRPAIQEARKVLKKLCP